MLNYWWVTRPKRRLNSIPEVLACCAKVSLDQEWRGMRNTHLLLEEELEVAGLKRRGERRDQKGGGAHISCMGFQSGPCIHSRKHRLLKAYPCG